MKRWGNFLLVIVTIQLNAQDNLLDSQGDLVVEDITSTVAKAIDQSSEDDLLLDDSVQGASQKQEVTIEDAPALTQDNEIVSEDLKESEQEEFIDEKQELGDSEPDMQDLDIIPATTTKQGESILPEPVEVVNGDAVENLEPEVLESENLEQEVEQQPVDESFINETSTQSSLREEPLDETSSVDEPSVDDSLIEEPIGEQQLEGEVQIDAPSLEQKPVSVSLPDDWQQAQKPGNYQKKAQIFKQAGDVYDKIRAVEPKILTAKESFFSKKATLNTTISEFFYEVGATQAEIAQQIDELIEKFDAEELEDDELLEEEREFVLELNQNKSDLNVLKQNIISLTDVSASLDNGLAQLDDLLSRVQTYEDSGWQLYQQIDEIFDDIQATDFLGQMVVIQENAEALLSYTQGTFAQFFNSSSSMIATQMAQIKSTLASLQARGIAIAQEEEQFETSEKAREEAEAQAKAQEIEAKRTQKTITWQNKVQDYFSSVWQWVKSFTQPLLESSTENVAKNAE